MGAFSPIRPAKWRAAFRYGEDPQPRMNVEVLENRLTPTTGLLLHCRHTGSETVAQQFSHGSLSQKT
jgi:hypothetical protein